MGADFPNQIESIQQITSDKRDVAVLASGASISLFGKIAGRGLYAVTEVILARVLGPSFYGLYAIGMTVLRIAATIGMLGTQNGVIHFGTRFWRSSLPELKRVLIYGIGYSVVSGLIIGISIYFFAPWLAIEVFHKPDLINAFRGFAIAFPFTIGLWVTSSATRITRRMKYYVISEEITQSSVNLLVVLTLSFIGLTVSGAVFAAVLSYFFAFCLALYYVWILFSEALEVRSPSSFPFQTFMLFSIPTGLAGTFTLLPGWISRLFIGFYRPAAEAGIYQAASQVSILFAMILSAMNSIYGPMIADLHHKNEYRRIDALYKTSTRWALYSILPIFIVICFIPRQFMAAIFGPAYIFGAIPLVILSCTQVVNVGTGAVGFLLTMTGHQNRWFITSILTFILALMLNAWLIPPLGMTGAALASAIAISGLFISGLIQVKLILGFWPYDRKYIKGLISVILTVCLLILINRNLQYFSPIIHLVINSFIAFIGFYSFLILQGLYSEDIEMIRVLSKRLRRVNFFS